MKKIRKLTAWVLAVVMACGMTVVPTGVTAVETTYPLGDVDLDGSVTATDLTRLAKAVGGIATLPANGYTVAPMTPSADRPDIRDKDGDGTIKVACVGDSITQGLGNTPYPNRLGNLLGSGYNVANYGLWGTTACNNTDRAYTNCSDSRYQESLDFAPEVVILMLGTNDGGGDASNAQTNFKADMRSLIASYQALESDPTVILVTSPYAYIDNNKNVNSIIAPMQRELADELGLFMVDMNALTENMASQFQDGLHPSESGYYYLALMFYQKIFDGNVAEVTVDTEPGAYVKLEAYETSADNSGLATFPMATGTRQLTVSKDGFETSITSVVLPETGATIDCALQPTANLALNGTAFTNGDNDITKAFDGDTSTSWQNSTTADDLIAGVTLTTSQTVASVNVMWEMATRASTTAGSFTVETSTDGVNWTAVQNASYTFGGGEYSTCVDYVTFTPVTASAIRIVIHSSSNSKYACKIYEMSVYGENNGQATITVTAKEGSVETGRVPLGDLDLDGEISATDLTVLARHVGRIELIVSDAYSVSTEGTPAIGNDLEDINGDGKIVVACLGDSITAGTSDANWPKFLGEYLTYLGSVDGKTYEVVNCGKGGAAVRDEPENIGSRFYYDDSETYLKSFEVDADVVIVQMGTNDASYGNGPVVNDYFVSDYVKYFVDPYLDMGAQLFLATTPHDYEHNLGWSDLNNGTICDLIRGIAADYDLPLIDTNVMTDGHRECFPDGLHGNASGYTMIAEIYYTHIFGGTTYTLDINTQAGASVKLTDKANTREYVRTADQTGLASFDFVDGLAFEFSLRILCDGYEGISDTLSIREAGTLSYPLTPITGTNVALTATAFDCGINVYGGTAVSTSINDANKTSGGYQPATWNEGDYVGLYLDDTYDVTTLYLYWETAAYVSSFADGGYEVWLRTPGTDDWTQLTDVTSARENYDGAIVMDTITLNAPVSADGVRVVYKNGKIADHKYAPKLYELQVMA